MPVLSIIVPVYNVAPYLAEGLDSLLKQKVEDMEIICVNDGSTDDSLSILEGYATKDKRINIINQENKGLSAARNVGLSYATGEYVVFFDSDDMVEPDMYLKMIEKAKYVDVVMCGYRTIPDNSIHIPEFPANMVCNPISFISVNKRLHTSNDLCFSWRFLFKRDFLGQNKLFFIEGIRYAEDFVFNLASIMMASSIFLIPEPLYLYRVNNVQSIMRHKYNRYMESGLQLQVAEKKRIISDYQLDKYTPITKDMSEDIVKRYTMILFRNLYNNPDNQYIYDGIKNILFMPMICDAMKVVGLRNMYSSWKEYVFFLAMKFKMVNVVEYLLSRSRVL